MSLPSGGLVPTKPGSARQSFGAIGGTSNPSGNVNSFGVIGGGGGGGGGGASPRGAVGGAGTGRRPTGDGQVPSSLPPATMPPAMMAAAAGGAASLNSSGAVGLGSGGAHSARAPDERILSAYEREELKTFDHGVYYSGESCTSKIQAPTTGPNYGFDDERGDYILVTGDHFRFRYEIKSILGRGSFGQVCQCLDHKTGQLVALKIIRNKKRFHQQAQVEIRVLAHLRDRDPDGKYGIVRFHESFVFRSHVCLTYECLSMNLFEYIKFNKFRPLPLNVVKKIGASVLISLAFMSRENIVHCDLKPENILLRQPNRTGVKVIDLGSACFESERLYTYIQSRFYRAPEVILGIPYTRKIDLWSFACVLCELAVGYPVFPGESEVDQLACMMEFLGVPPKHFLDEAPRRSVFFDPPATEGSSNSSNGVIGSNYQPKLVPNSRKKIRHPNGKVLYKFLNLEEDHPFVHFVSMFFRWDPSERPHAEPAMRHPWICDAYVGVTPKMPVVPGLTAPASLTASSSSQAPQHQQQQQPQPPQQGKTAVAPQSKTLSQQQHQQQQQPQRQEEATSARRVITDISARGVGDGAFAGSNPATARGAPTTASTTATSSATASSSAGAATTNSSMFPSITTPRHPGATGHG